MDGAGKAGRGERSREEIAVMDGEADLAAADLVEIGMAAKEAVRFRRRRLAKAVNVMVAVAFGMRNAEQRAQCEILLHGEAGLAGEVLAGDEISRALRAPFRRARRVANGLADALAG